MMFVLRSLYAKLTKNAQVKHQTLVPYIVNLERKKMICHSILIKVENFGVDELTLCIVISVEQR